MCGIAGCNWQNEKIIRKMTNQLSHRGPDADGYFINSFISLGHRRLSIIDLSAQANQPMKHSEFIIVFNGEIYNYQEIRQELEKLGHKFKLNSDTEVILHSYQEWGEKCTSRFNGMWAMCIYNQKTHNIFLSRDRFGIKPLYYWNSGNKLAFSSEITSLSTHLKKKEINHSAVNAYFYQKYLPSDLSIFNSIHQLKPGHNLSWNHAHSKLVTKKYYNLESEVGKFQSQSLSQKKDEINTFLQNSISSRLISDVPVGSFLSGGIDSSYITAQIFKLSPELKSFSIGFKSSSYDELAYAKKVAAFIGVKNIHSHISLDDNFIEKVLTKFHQPFGDASVLPTYALSEMTRKHVAVSLSGDGADEIFGGYDTYFGQYVSDKIPSYTLSLLNRLSQLLPTTHQKVSSSFKIKRFLRNANESDPIIRHLSWMATYSAETRKELLNSYYSPVQKYFSSNKFPSNLLSVQLNDMQNYLAEDILKKLDFASMAHGLEARVPFLDHRLVPIALSLPDSKKINVRQQKILLKKFAHHLLPKEIISRPKRGFTVPISDWLTHSKLMNKFLSQKQYYQHGFIDYNYSRQLYSAHLDRKDDLSRELWLVFVFNYWMHKQ